jgi:hypothetical protein
MVFFFAAALRDPPPELFFAADGRAAGRLEAERFAGAALRAELFFAPPPLAPPRLALARLAPPFFAAPFFEAPPFFPPPPPPLREDALDAELRFAEAAPLDDLLADFFDEPLEDDDAFEEDFEELDDFEDFAADFFEDLPADLPEDLAALFAEDFFALFFAAILFLLFKSFGWGAVRFDERTYAASYNPVHELHELQCRRT